MTDINSSSNDNENKESLKKQENTFNDLLERKTKKLAKEKIKENWFIEKFKLKKYNGNDFKSEILESFNDFEKSRYIKLIEWLDNSKIDELFNIFKIEIWLLSYPYDFSFNELFNYFDEKYKFDDKKRKILKEQLNWMSQNELDSLIKSSQIKKEWFLNDLFWKWKVKLKDSENKKLFHELLSWVDFSSEIKSRIINKIWEIKFNDNIDELRELFETLKSLNNVTPSIISDLFNYDILTTEDKRYFLIEMIPFVSLWDLLKSWIVDKNYAETKIRKELVNSWKTDENEIKYIIENSDFDDFIINTKELVSNLSNDKLNSFTSYVKFANNFSENYNSIISELKEKYLNNVWNLELFKEKISKNIQIQRKIVDYKNFSTNFLPWSVIQFKSWKKWEISNEWLFFYEIVNFNDDWSFTFIDRSNWINQFSSKKWEISKWYYSSLFETFWNNEIKEIEILSKKDIERKINLWEISELKDDYEDKNLDDFWNLDNRRSEIRSKLNDISTWKDLDELEKNDEIKKLINELDLIDEKIWTNLEDFNLNYFKEKIDLLDPDWKNYWLKKWTSFKITKQWIKRNWAIYTIESIDKDSWEIVVKQWDWKKEKWTFREFYNLFKSLDIKRFSDCEDFSKLNQILTLDKNIWESWKWTEVKNGKLIKKDWSKEIVNDYLIAKSWEWDKLIKIHEIHNWYVTISPWEIIEEQWKWKKWEKITNEIFSVADEKIDVTIWFLEDYIKSNKLEPWSKDKNIEKLPKWEDRKWSFSKWLFSNKSIAEMIKWVKIWIDSIEHYLKEWNEEHANHFALSVFWKYLPIELKSDLISRVEQSEKKHTDEYINKLKWVDSPDATRMIEKWLNTKNINQQKLEAWALFMLESYWTLYAKEIYKYKWKFLWYEALWWTIWDRLYIEVKKEVEDLWKQFTEEELIHRLVKQQCKSDWHHYSWVHRRSRFHKDFEWAWKSWMTKDYDKWKDDSWKKRTFKWRVDWAMWELFWWTYPNAMWWFEWIIEKWWPMNEMNKLPFVMLFSWIAYNFTETMADKFKGNMGKGRLIPTARFISLTSDIELYNNTVLELSKRLWELYWDKNDKFKSMYWKAKKIIDNIWSISENKQVNETIKFFDEYWDILTRSMFMLNDTKDDEYNYVNKLIFNEKDSNPTFANYYKKFKDYADQDANFWVEDLMTDAFKWAWTSWFDLYKFTKETLQYHNSWWFRKEKIWESAWTEVEDMFLKVPNRKYFWEKNKDDEINKKFIKKSLREFIAWILFSHWTWDWLRNINWKWTHFSKVLDKYWIDLTEFKENNINYSELLNWKNPVAEWILDRYVNNWLDWKDHSKDRGIDWVITFTWWSIADALTKPPANDEEFQKVA